MTTRSKYKLIALCPLIFMATPSQAKKRKNKKRTPVAEKTSPSPKKEAAKVSPPVKATPKISKKTPPRKSQRESKIGLALELYNEDSFFSATRDFDGATVDRSSDYEAGFTSLRAWYMRPIGSRWGLVGGIAYRRNYEGPDDFVFGQLIDMLAEFEGRFSLYKSWKLRLAGQIGIATLIPTKDFKAEIDRLNADGLGVFSGPRFGWLSGGSVGVTFPITKQLYFFSAVGANWGRLYLFRSKKTIDNINVNNNWTAVIKRRTFDLGVEVSF